MGPLQGVLAPLGALVGPPGAFSGREYGFSHFWSPSWAPLVAVLELSRAVLGACWAVFGLSWRVLGPSWAIFGRPLWPLGASRNVGKPERRECRKHCRWQPLTSGHWRPPAFAGGRQGPLGSPPAQVRDFGSLLYTLYIYNVTNVNGRATCVCGRSTVAAGSLERAATGDLPQLVQLREVLSGQTTGGS